MSGSLVLTPALTVAATAMRVSELEHETGGHHGQ